MKTLSQMVIGRWSLDRREPAETPRTVVIDGLTWQDTGRGDASCSIVGRSFAVTTGEDGHRLVTELIPGNVLLVLADGQMTDAEVCGVVYDELMTERPAPRALWPVPRFLEVMVGRRLESGHEKPQIPPTP